MPKSQNVGKNEVIVFEFNYPSLSSLHLLALTFVLECADILWGAFSNPASPTACYTENSQTRTWSEAQSYCSALPGGNWTLIDVEDEAEDYFLELQIRDKYP